MSKKPRSINQRARSYASGIVGHSVGGGTSDAKTYLARGWEDGYKAALRDTKHIAQSLVQDTEQALVTSLAEVVTAAGQVFKKELERIK